MFAPGGGDQSVSLVTAMVVRVKRAVTLTVVCTQAGSRVGSLFFLCPQVRGPTCCRDTVSSRMSRHVLQVVPAGTGSLKRRRASSADMSTGTESKGGSSGATGGGGGCSPRLMSLWGLDDDECDLGDSWPAPCSTVRAPPHGAPSFTSSSVPCWPGVPRAMLVPVHVGSPCAGVAYAGRLLPF
jgi:hypothetical protein